MRRLDGEHCTDLTFRRNSITFEPIPSDIALLNVWEVPENGGGDTLWASAYEVRH
jgi:hypothetical protein